MTPNKEKLDDLATKVAAEILALTASVNDKLHAELLSATNIPTHAGQHNYVWLEIAYFGSYLLRQKVTNSMSKQEQNIFDPLLKERFLFYVTNVAFESKGEGAESLRLMIGSTYDARLKEYAEYRGDVSTLFKEELKNAFNSQSQGKIKFVDKSFKTKLKLKVAFFLAALGGNKEFLEQHGDEIFLPDSVLTSTAATVNKMFRETELNLGMFSK